MNWYTFVSAVSAIGGLGLSWLSFWLANQKKAASEARELGIITSELANLRAGVAEIKVQTRDICHRISVLEAGLARIEESNVQTQKRIDRFESCTSQGRDGVIS